VQRRPHSKLHRLSSIQGVKKSYQPKSVNSAISPHTIDTKSTPEVFFSSVARSSLGSSTINKNVSFACVIKSGHASPSYNVQLPPTVSYQPAGHTENKMETMMLRLQLSMDELISFKRTTMQSMLTN